MIGFMDFSLPLVVLLVWALIVIPMVVILGAPFLSLLGAIIVMIREGVHRGWNYVVNKGYTRDHLPIVYRRPSQPQPHSP